MNARSPQPPHPAPAPRAGQRNAYFDARAIAGWLLTALLHAGLILAAVLAGAQAAGVDRASGAAPGLGQGGVLMFTAVIVTVHCQLGAVIDQWTLAHHASCWGSVGAAGGAPARARACALATGTAATITLLHCGRAAHCRRRPRRPPPALWFLFLAVFGALPISLSGDLHGLFAGAVAPCPLFWLVAAGVPALCVLPTWGARAAARYLAPAYYEVVQEIAARERRGEDVFGARAAAGGAAQGGRARRGESAAADLAARAGRLAARAAHKAAAASAAAAAAAAAKAPGLLAAAASGGGGAPPASPAGALTAFRKRYSGFVPPYEARSRVFDASELRASALAAGYAISRTGEIVAPPQGRGSGGGGGGGLLGGGTAPGGFNAAATVAAGEPWAGGWPPSAAATHGRASLAPPAPPPPGSALARAISSIGANGGAGGSFGRHRRSMSAGAALLRTLSAGPGGGGGVLPPVQGDAGSPMLPLGRLSVGRPGAGGFGPFTTTAMLARSGSIFAGGGLAGDGGGGGGPRSRAPTRTRATPCSRSWSASSTATHGATGTAASSRSRLSTPPGARARVFTARGGAGLTPSLCLHTSSREQHPIHATTLPQDPLALAQGGPRLARQHPCVAWRLAERAAPRQLGGAVAAAAGRRRQHR